MARRAARRPVRKPVTTAWTSAHAEVFRLAKGLTPPKTVQVRRTVRGYSLVALFTDERGCPVRCRTRLAWDACESLRVVDEQLSIALKVGGRP